MKDSDKGTHEGDSVAVLAEILFLANLLVMPLFSFIALLWYYRKRASYSPLASEHLQQAISTSIWAGILLFVVNMAIFLTMGYESPYIWMMVLIYFTMGHSTFILLGVFGLTRAMAGKSFKYPLPNLIKS
ncbi:MAG: hypothetical protein GQ470_07060 [Gammaproteobacteria bacterium]|nr:hypothetical protein [Gammaproteobacteria bacterium]